MEFGPDQVVLCPHCKGPEKYMTMESGNTFGASRWTDGRTDAPMMVNPPAVVTCRRCARCYWLEQAERVDDGEAWREATPPADPALAAIWYVREATEEEYFDAIDKKELAAEPVQERRLRILAWWRGNNAFRGLGGHPASGHTADPARRRRNLLALAELLPGHADNVRLLKAEVLRELGEFQAAREILVGLRSGDMAGIARQIEILCDRGDPCVRPLRVDR